MIEPRAYRFRHLRLIAAVPVLVACIIGPCLAAEPAQAQAAGGVRASALVGMPVTNDRDQKLGKVDDLIVSRSGTITRVVILVGGSAGRGDKRVAVPYRDLKVSPDRVVYAVTPESLQALPEFKYPERQTADATSGERERYTDQAKQRMSEFEGRLDQAKKGASEGASEAGRRLDQAWSEVQNKWADVEKASNDGWNRAKSDFERSWRNLQRTFKDATR